MIGSKKLLAQYHGSSLTTQSCLDALARVLAADVAIARALLLTHGDRHGFYLEVEGRGPRDLRLRSIFCGGFRLTSTKSRLSTVYCNGSMREI